MYYYHFLKKKKHFNTDDCLEVLYVIKELSPALDTGSCGKILPLLGPLLASISCQDVRITICQVLELFARADPSLLLVAKLLADLNSFSATTMGEYDYDRRLQAYARLSPTLFSELAYPQTLLVITQAVYDMAAEDISIRHSSSKCLFSFIHFASSVSAKEQEGSSKKHLVDEENINFMGSEENVSPAADAIKEDQRPLPLFCWSFQSVNAVVQNILFPHLMNAMSIDVLTVRREWVLVLREMVVNLPNNASISEYLPLVSTDLEVDFYHNINHIQSHRRIKAMARFKVLCYAGKFHQRTLLRIFVPLFMNSLFEAKGDKEGNLVTAAVDTLACIAAQLEWESYFSLLIRLFRMMASKRGYEKVLVRLICSILDKFHFFETNCVKQGVQEVQMDSSGKEQCHGPLDGSLNTDYSASGAAESENKDRQLDIQNRLQERLLPELTKLLVSKANIVNTTVALAVVKILKLMPEEVMELELPRIVQNIVNLLKNRSQAVRDEARASLVAVVKVLGARYLHFIVDSLQSSLTRGYEVHVLGFTLHSILMKLVPLVSIGQMDYCAERILEVLGNDMFGDVSEEKEVEKIAFKMKETKRIQSYESIRMLAQVVTFRTHATILLKPAMENLHRSLTPKMKLKIEMMLRQLALGIQGNLSLKQEELLVFLHGLVERGMMEEKAGRKVAAGGCQLRIDGSKVGDKRKFFLNETENCSQEQPFESKSSIPNMHLLTEFALQLLHNHLKHVPRNKQDLHVLSMLDPLVNLLHDCLESKYEGVLSLSMKCLCQLFRFPLPSIDTLGDRLFNWVLSMAQKFGKKENLLVQACFDLLMALLKHAKIAEVSNEQLQILLQLPIFTDLESGGSNTSLLLLKAVVGRKLLVPELYDIMNRVAQLMVASQAASVRQICSQIILQFLLDYPLGFRRLQQHIDFFVANLSYEHASGREAALEMLHAVIVKFPDQVVDEQSETLFLPLVTRLVNDDAMHVREMIGAVLKVLMVRVSQRSLQRMLNFCFSWLKEEKHHLWCPSAQVLGFLIEIMKGRFSQYVQDAVFMTKTILKHVSNFRDDETTDNSTVPAFWQEAYYALTMFEKLLRQFTDICFLKDLEDLWDLICSFLLHRHIWLRKVSCRLVGTYFVACGLSTEAVAIAKEAFLLQPSRLMVLAATFCQQLDTEIVDDALAEQITKNLHFVTHALYYLTPNPQKETSWTEIVNVGDHSIHVRVSHALDLLDLGGLKGHRNVVDASLIEAVQTERTKQEIVPQWRKYFLLWPIFRKLKKIFLQIQDVQTRAILKWYSAISKELGPDGLQPYLSSMMVPLYKITESFASKSVPDDLKTLSEEVLIHIKELVGVGEFVKAYNEARQAVKDSREKRKRIKKLNVLVDPERHAKRKMTLTIKHQAQKKRKILRSRT